VKAKQRGKAGGDGRSRWKGEGRGWGEQEKMEGEKGARGRGGRKWKGAGGGRARGERDGGRKGQGIIRRGGTEEAG